MLKRISLPLAFVTLGATHAAMAASTYDEGQWIATFKVGTSLIPKGSFQAAQSQGNVAIDRLQFDDIYDVGIGFGLELGYRVAPNLEPFVRVDYSQMRGDEVRIGQISTAGLVSPVRGDFDDMKSWSLDVGARYFFLDNSPVRPYLAAYVGADRADEVFSHLSVNGVPVDSGKERLLPRETRFNAGVEAGVSYQLAEKAALRFSVGADYASSRHEDSAAYDAIGLDHVRITEDSWTIPVDLGFSYQF